MRGGDFNMPPGVSAASIPGNEPTRKRAPSTAVATTTTGDRDRRRTYIGGSDAASILGVSKWRTPLQTYFLKIGQDHEAGLTEWDEKREKAFRRGKRKEPLIIEDLVIEHDVVVVKVSTPEAPNYHTDPEFPWMKAEVDFEWKVTQPLAELLSLDPALIGTIQNGEIKTVHPLAAHMWGDEYSDEVQVDYHAQSMHGLMVTGRQVCLYGVSIGDDLLLYKVLRDDETIAGMREREIAFWTKNVLQQIPPDPVNLDDMMRLFARQRGKPVQLDDDHLTLLVQLRDIRQRRTTMKADAEDLAFRIADYIRRQWEADTVEAIADDASLLHGKDVVGTWKSQSKRTIDSKRLEAEKPDVAKEYTRTTHHRVLRFTKNLT